MLESITDTWWAGAFDRALETTRSDKKKKKKKKDKKDNMRESEDKNGHVSKRAKKEVRKTSVDSDNSQDEEKSVTIKKKKDKKRSSGSMLGGLDYGELFKATGGVRPGMRARGSQQGKWTRTENL